MQRQTIFGAVALSVSVLSPITAKAADVSLSFGATLTSEYVSSGLRYSDGPAFQPYVEVGFGSFYAGAYTSNAEVDFLGDDRENGVYLGYAGEAGSFSYDVSLNYYLYSDLEDSAEAIFSGTVAATDTLYVTGTVGIAPEYEQTNASLRVDYYTAVEGLSLDATVGSFDANYGDWDYWSVGATYQINDNIGLGLAYHDSNVDPAVGVNTDGLIVASVNFDFSTP